MLEDIDRTIFFLSTKSFPASSISTDIDLLGSLTDMNTSMKNIKENKDGRIRMIRPIEDVVVHLCI